MRNTKTEFVSCPSCGRTLFDLQETTAEIQKKTGHLPGMRFCSFLFVCVFSVGCLSCAFVFLPCAVLVYWDLAACPAVCMGRFIPFFGGGACDLCLCLV